MLLTIGLEKEFFVFNSEGQPVLVPSQIPKDSCGWLAEARGEPFPNVLNAVYSLKADIDRISRELNRRNPKLKLVDDPLVTLSRDFRISAARQTNKGPIRYQNLYGHHRHRNPQSQATAGLHISFTNHQLVCSVPGGMSYYRNLMFDFAQLFMKLDEAFANEIKEAKRNPGFYELKVDGRIEYRSLPANIDLNKVADVLLKVLDDTDSGPIDDEDDGTHR